MSAIPTFKAALLARIEAIADIVTDQVQVSWGHPFPKFLERELVFLGKTALAEDGTEPVGLGYGVGVTDRDEHFTQEVIVSVAGAPQTSQQTMETRAFVIAHLVEASIIAWATGATPYGNTLGGGWAIPAGMEPDEALEVGADDIVTGREASVRFLVDVVARLSS